MVENIKVSIEMIENMDSVSMNGQIQKFIRDGGIKVNNMEQVFSKVNKVNKK
jgi:hypothetical protein